MKDAYYFKHDCNARNDPKIKSLINSYGVEGYGRYFMVLEILRETTAYQLEDKVYIWESLAEQFKCNLDEAKKFISDCINKFELFEQGEGYFYSPSLLKRMVKLNEIRLKRQTAASTRWDT